MSRLPELTIGGKTFEGDEYLLVTTLPARPADDAGPGYPQFVLYAGTGTPGTGEITGVSGGLESILVADRFGKLPVGRWETGPRGVVARFGPAARRIEWREIERDLGGAGKYAGKTLDETRPSSRGRDPRPPSCRAPVSGSDRNPKPMRWAP